MDMMINIYPPKLDNFTEITNIVQGLTATDTYTWRIWCHLSFTGRFKT